MSEVLSIALFDAHFMPYVLLAIAVLVIRAWGLKMRRNEVYLALLFCLFLAVEGEQMSVSGWLRDSVEGVAVANRYFGVFAPFLWIFAAKGVSWLWGHSKPFVRWPGRILAVLGILFIFLSINVGRLVGYRCRGTALDTSVAVANIVPVIRDDYTGPSKQPDVKRTLREYYTGRRPLISSPYAAAGWAVRGDACGATGIPCPYQEDYLFLPLGGNYNDIKEVDSRVYTFVAHVRGGLGTTWALFRRRTTPGKTTL